MSRRRSGWNARRYSVIAVLALAFAAGIYAELSGGRPVAAPEGPPQELREAKTQAESLLGEVSSAAVRLPVAALLGALLALRPRRHPTVRKSVVVQTQIVLAVVGALIMLIVGASLARAFGIVGVASLVRYRSKIDDPKDAVVMLSALAVGLGCGVGLFLLAFFSTLFLIGTLWVIESYEPEVRVFELKVKLGAGTAELRSEIEAVLARLTSDFELRGSAAEEATYLVRAPQDFSTVEATEALTALVPDNKGAVDWVETSKAR